MSYTYTTIFDTSTDGPLVQGVSFQGGAQLLFDYQFNYPAFLQDVVNLVNGKLITAENALPEGELVQMTITGWNGMSGQVATTINTQWAKGAITATDGTTLKAWPGLNHIAVADTSTDTVYLTWVKEGVFAWILVGVVIALVLGAALYYVLSQSHANMQKLTPTQKLSQTASTASANALQWSMQNWPILAVGAVGLAATPWVLKKIAESKEAEREIRGDQ